MADDPQVSITIEGVKFGYNGTEVLKGVEFEGKRGEFIGLIGPNGSGKSTLMRLMNGILKPQVGTIWLEGKDLDKMKVDEIARVCANVPTEFTEDFSMSVQDLVFLGRYPFAKGLWWDNKEDEGMVAEAMKKFGVYHLRDRRFSELSSGEAQRVLLAKAVVQCPRVMLVDEPSAHLDLKYKLEVMEHLRELLSGNVTIVIASHDLNLLAKYCDRVMILSKGKIIAFGTPREVITAEMVEKVYGVEVVVLDDGEDIFAIPRRTKRREEGQ
ncbi:MAG: ABC transporter ATP-binding protein [Methanomassiliicoccus sp.]|nr:ABC transporter ATP-binding protein [Methanomassiliicoccus sp.]